MEPHKIHASLYCLAIIKYSLNTDAGGFVVKKVYWEDSGDNVLNSPTLCQLLAGISCFSLRPQRDGARQLKQNFLVRGVAVCRANDESKSAHRQFTVRLLSILLAHKFCLDSMSM